MNHCTFCGRLVDDPLLKNVNGTSLVTFTLAVEEHRRDNQGHNRKRVEFLDFEAWDSGADAIKSYCSKGDLLLVEGIARQQRWKSDGQNRSKINFRVSKFRNFTGKSENTND